MPTITSEMIDAALAAVNDAADDEARASAQDAFDKLEKDLEAEKAAEALAARAAAMRGSVVPATAPAPSPISMETQDETKYGLTHAIADALSGNALHEVNLNEYGLAEKFVAPGMIETFAAVGTGVAGGVAFPATPYPQVRDVRTSSWVAKAGLVVTNEPFNSDENIIHVNPRGVVLATTNQSDPYTEKVAAVENVKAKFIKKTGYVDVTEEAMRGNMPQGLVDRITNGLQTSAMFALDDHVLNINDSGIGTGVAHATQNIAATLAYSAVDEGKLDEWVASLDSDYVPGAFVLGSRVGIANAKSKLGQNTKNNANNGPGLLLGYPTVETSLVTDFGTTNGILYLVSPDAVYIRQDMDGSFLSVNTSIREGNGEVRIYLKTYVSAGVFFRTASPIVKTVVGIKTTS